ncbi:MAG: BTAD domain-containing putative transcriptional regulator [Acidimicrobiales bacterium]
MIPAVWAVRGRSNNPAHGVDPIRLLHGLRRHEQRIGELRALTAEHPLRESLHARLALALYRSGRQSEALRALADARRLLRDELGLEPSRPLADLELAILNQDPTLDPPPPVLVRADTDNTSAFVGRDQEFEALVASYNAADQDARFVVIEGDPGIGKTTPAGTRTPASLNNHANSAWPASSPSSGVRS